MINRQTESISGRDNRMANQVLIRINDCGTKFDAGVPDSRRTNTKAFCYKRGIQPIKSNPQIEVISLHVKVRKTEMKSIQNFYTPARK